MLAHPYGFTRVMSSYSWSRNFQGGEDHNNWQGPPHNGDMSIKSPSIQSDNSCGNGWVGLFTCGFSPHSRILSLIWGRHQYRCRAGQVVNINAIKYNVWLSITLIHLTNEKITVNLIIIPLRGVNILREKLYSFVDYKHTQLFKKHPRQLNQFYESCFLRSASTDGVKYTTWWPSETLSWERH